MGTRAPSIFAAALGQIRYRLALAVIGFGLFIGWLLACAIPLCVYGSYFDVGGPIGETFRWAITGSVCLIAVGLTYHCRSWIVRKALEEASPEPVDVVGAALALIQSAFGVVGLLLAVVVTAVSLIIAAILVYGGYLLVTMLSVPAAILIGAIIIALSVLIAAFARSG